MIIRRLLSLFILIFLLSVNSEILAKEGSTFVTVVYPLRSRMLWQDQRIVSLDQQVNIASSLNIPVTYLVEYDNLFDKEIVERLRLLKSENEIGILLEVSEQLATDSFVPYPIGSGDWARPDKVFFSGYKLAERRRMIDKLIRKFTATFARLPVSAGSWYVDAETLNYLNNKYQVKAVLTVADQYSTDTYHVWGKYFGIPYYPSKYNTLMPAHSSDTKADVVMTQWAQRDPIRSYGSDVDASTYSLQANDYQGHHQLTTDYFKRLLSFYMRGQENDFGQITLGLEVGQETRFIPELARQIAYLNDLRNAGVVKVVTMSEFAAWYRRAYPAISPPHILYASEDDDQQKISFWYMSPWYRVNLILEQGKLYIKDLRFYDDQYIERDRLSPDKQTKLYRTVTAEIDNLVLHNQKILFSNVAKLAIKINKGKVNLQVDNEGQTSVISLSEKNMDIASLDFAHLLKQQPLKLRNRLLLPAELLVARLEDGLPGVYFSNVDDSFIAGWRWERESLLGIKLHPIHIGVFYYPFQTLAFFKRFPAISLNRLFTPDTEVQARNTSSKFPKGSLVRRQDQSLEKISLWENSGRKRVFENSDYAIWLTNEDL